MRAGKESLLEPLKMKWKCPFNKTVKNYLETVLEFYDFLQDLTVTMHQNLTQANQSYLDKIVDNVDGVTDAYADAFQVLNIYDKSLINVLDQHKEDFLHAYKLHMQKIEKELTSL